MKNLTLDQLRLLAQQIQSPSISIFLPTDRAGQDAQQDPIRTFTYGKLTGMT